MSGRQSALAPVGGEGPRLFHLPQPADLEETCPLVYQCCLPLSPRTVNHLAGLLRRRLKVIRSRWRILPLGKVAVTVLVVLRHDQRLADMAGGDDVSEPTVRRRRDELIRLLAAWLCRCYASNRVRTLRKRTCAFRGRYGFGYVTLGAVDRGDDERRTEASGGGRV